MGAGEAKDANPGAARLFGLHLRDAESFALSIISSWGEIGMTAARALRDRFRAIVFGILDVRSSPDQPLSDAVETPSVARMPSASSRKFAATIANSRATADRGAGAPWGTSQVSAEIS
jgi:hypothetical protein